MKRKKLGIASPWDIPAAVGAVLLFGNFAVFVALLITAMGRVFLEPVVAIVTAALLLAGILCHLVTRRKTGKLWRRLLLAAIAANLLIVAFYVLATILMVLAWADVGKEG